MLAEKRRLPRPGEAPEDWYLEISKCWAEQWGDRPTFKEILQALKALRLPEDDSRRASTLRKSDVRMDADGYVVDDNNG